MKKLKIFVILLLCVSLVTLTGCWDYIDIDRFAIVSGVAIDKPVNDNNYHLTFEIADISNGSESPIKPIILESEGRSMYEAISNASLKSSLKLYFSHCSLFILSKDIAKEGILPILDYINRDSVMRIKSHIAVSTMNTAKELLLANPTSEHLVAYEISDLLLKDSKDSAKSPLVWLYQTADIVDGEGIALTVPAIKTISQDNSINEKGKSGGSGSSSGGESKSKSDSEGNKIKSAQIPLIVGSGVFNEDKLIGFLTPDETQNLMFVKDKVKRGPMFIKKGINGKGVTLNITDSKTEITPEVKGNDVTMKIKIKTKASLIDDESETTYETEEEIKKLGIIAGDQLKEQVTKVIKKVQKDFNSDIFGFGKKIYEKDFKDWQTLEKNWKENFRSVKVDVEAKVEIVSTSVEKSKIGGK